MSKRTTNETARTREFDRIEFRKARRQRIAAKHAWCDNRARD